MHKLVIYEKLEECLEDMEQLRLEIDKEASMISADMKNTNSSFLSHAYAKKTYQSMGIIMCETIIKKHMESINEEN